MPTNFESWDKSDLAFFTTVEDAISASSNLKDLQRELDDFLSYPQSHSLNQETHDLYEQVITALGSDAETIAISFFVNPAKHHIKGVPLREKRTINDIAMRICAIYIRKNLSGNALHALTTRIELILRTPIGRREREVSDHPGSEASENQYFYPSARDCIEILAENIKNLAVLDYLAELFSGKFNRLAQLGEDADNYFENTYGEYLQGMHETFEQIVVALHEQGKFTYAWFSSVATIEPRYLRVGRLNNEAHEQSDHATTLPDAYNEYTHQFIDQQLDKFPASAKILNELIKPGQLTGFRSLVTGLRLINKLNLSAAELTLDSASNTVVRNLIAVSGFDINETEAQVVEKLKSFDESLLARALPFAGYARNALLDAMGWGSLKEFQRHFFNLAKNKVDTIRPLRDIYLGESEYCGYINRALWIDVLRSLDPILIDKYMDAFSNTGVNDCLMLVAAIMGKDRKKVEKKLAHHAQAAIKAYGLYEVENDEDLRQRYLKFKTMHKEAKQYGSERQRNTEVACNVGLKNLAQTAGFTDETRMEWAVEAGITENAMEFGCNIAADAWDIRLVLQGATPKIEVYKDNKLLKSVPPKVRKADSYKQMRDTQISMQEQSSRFCKSLEDMMCAGESIPAEELTTLTRLPVMKAMLSQLVICCEGKFGMLKDNSVVSFNNKTSPLSSDIKIAHVYDLYSAGVLSEWQRHVINNRITQPFKQAFRELYVVTPAEKKSGGSSARFAGKKITSSKASRLLQTRAWRQESNGGLEVFKRFPHLGITAEIEFEDVANYLTESNYATMGDIVFHTTGGRLSLNNVDKIIFSEVMRDADLVVSAAHGNEATNCWSNETTERRSELISLLVASLQLNGVHCDNNVVCITGTLANYRIHLGSGNIHIEQGHHLCIIPASKMQLENVYLPFSDEDGKTAEIISKIFLLVADHNITDKDILSQITQDK